MILPRPRLGQRGREVDQVGRRDRADLGADMRAQFGLQRRRSFLARDQGDVAVDALALDVVRVADHRGLGDERVADQGALDLGRAEPVAGDVEHVVDPAGDPVIIVLVAAAAVAGEIFAFDRR